MKAIRRALNGRHFSPVAVVLVAWLVLAQGVLGAFSGAVMASAAVGDPAFAAICASPVSAPSPLGDSTGRPGHPVSHDCCTVACQAACAGGSALLAAATPVAFVGVFSDVFSRTATSRRGADDRGFRAEARAPPSLSI